MTHPAHTPTPESVEHEVRSNILGQAIVPDAPDVARAQDLNLPHEFVRRAADRVIRGSFEERHRAVVEDRPGRNPPAGPHIIDREHWPALRGWRPALLPTDDRWDESFPSHAEPQLRQAAEHVARRLAHDGIARTVCDLCAMLPGATELSLRRVGVPTDLAAWFTIDGAPLIEHALRGGRDHARAAFSPRQTLHDFHAADESGAHPATLFRTQMTRPDHWLDAIPDGAGGPGSGDNFDVLLGLLRSMGHAECLVAIDGPHAALLHQSLARTPDLAARVHVVPAPAPVSQWAQDNLVPGSAPSGRACLLPRFASRAEIGAKLDTADSAALAPVAAELHTRFGVLCAHSPLHFQGGNVMLVQRADGHRILLLGEGEIARNTTLGLTPEQAELALRIEFGADSSAVLPAVGFHLDTEISVRRIGAELVAFVPDNEAAARLIVGAASRALANAGVLSPADARAVKTFLEMRNDERVVQMLGALFAHASDPQGNLAASAASIFRDGPADPPAGNAMRILTALDFLASLRERPWDASLHPHARAYARSLRRLEDDRRLLHERLRDAGIRLVPVPSLSLGGRSASVINMIHLPGLILVPRRAGFLRPLDDAACRVLQREAGPDVRIVGIPCAESERRGGALHCSVNVFPDA